MASVERDGQHSRLKKPRKTRGRGLRTATGCITCRKRHVKCDETKPTCRQCQRKQEACTFPEAVQVYSPGARDVVETGGDTPGTQSTSHENQSGYPTLEPQRRGNSIEDGFLATSPAISIPASVDQPISVATAQWFRMLAKDAEFEYDPTLDFGPLFQNQTISIPADNVSSNVPVDNQETYSWTAAWNQQVPNPTPRSPWQSQTPMRLKQHELPVFEEFITHISLWIDLFDPYRHFSSLVPRLALYNGGLLNAVLALSFRQKSLSGGSTEWPSFPREEALQYYHETLQYVRNAMQHKSYHTSLEFLATTLIISTYEMIDGSSQNWERHLRGVFLIQRSQTIHGDSGGLRAAVWWAWLCQDVWAAFREKRRVFTFWNPDRALADLNPSELAARSVFILAKVMDYCVQDESDNVSNTILARLQTAETLSEKLDEWESLTTAEFSPLPRNVAGDSDLAVFRPCWINPPLFAVAVQVHHVSRILILLHQPSLGGIKESMQRQAALDRCVEVIGGIASMLTDYASSILTSQCLFVAGLCTNGLRRRSEIVRLLQMCRSRTGWPVTPLDAELHQCWQDTGTVP